MTLPTHAFAPIEIKPRTGEPYLSEATNKKFLGQPRGIYLGFIPQVTPGSLVLTLAVDPVYALSLARVESSLEASNVDVVAEGPVTLDFTGHNFLLNPTVYVKVNAQSKLGSPTVASVYTTATPGSTATDQLICVVTKPAANLVAVFDAPTNRATPYAYGSAPLGYGFMGDSAVEQLLEAVAMVAEVAAARLDLAGVTHAYGPAIAGPGTVAVVNGSKVVNGAGTTFLSTFVPGQIIHFGAQADAAYEIKSIPSNGVMNLVNAYSGPNAGATTISINFGLTDRVAADLEATAIANRLGLGYRVLRGQDYAVAAPASSVNVSSSFAKAGRTRPPVVTIAPNGSETQAGAITDADTRNVCFIMQVGTNERPIDANRTVAYGRLTTAIQVLAGTLTFNGTVNVVGAGTSFLDPSLGVKVGDLVLAPDGDYYVVATVPTNLSLTLTTTAPAGAITSTRRRFTLSAVKRNPTDNTEIPYTIAGGTTIRFFFGAWFDLSQSIHDSTLLMFEGGEETPLPDATTAVKGKAIMFPGVTGAVGGAVNVLDAGNTVGSGKPTYSLNFKGAALNPGAGIANISASGPIGPQGAPGTGPGPPGNPGANGTAFNNFSVPFSAGPFNTAPGGGWPSGTVLSHEITFPGKLRYLHGGLAVWQVPAPNVDGNDNYAITTVKVTNPGGAGDTGRIENTISSTFDTDGPPACNIQLFLNGAG